MTCLWENFQESAQIWIYIIGWDSSMHKQNREIWKRYFKAITILAKWITTFQNFFGKVEFELNQVTYL